MILIILLINTSTIAIATINPDAYKPKDPSSADVGNITKIANPIIGTVQVVGIIIAVITLSVLGIKYMTGSVSEKAEYKKIMIPYLVGAFFVVGITQILGIIIKVVTNIK